jgi:predicted MFS family arabinose efflux permease
VRKKSRTLLIEKEKIIMTDLLFFMMIGTLFLGYLRKVGKKRIYTFLFFAVIYLAYLIVPKNEPFVHFLLLFIAFFVFGLFIQKLSRLFVAGIGNKPDGEPEE